MNILELLDHGEIILRDDDHDWVVVWDHVKNELEIYKWEDDKPMGIGYVFYEKITIHIPHDRKSIYQMASEFIIRCDFI